MKTFLLGMLIGAALATFAVVRMHGTTSIASSAPTSPDSKVSVELSSSPLPASDVVGEPSNRSQELNPINLAAERKTVTGVEGAGKARTCDQYTFTDAWIEELGEKAVTDICTRASDLRTKKERAKKDAEPKDEAWAYAMEMLIRQHVESQIPASQYTKLQIRCRTTFCELNITGSEQETRERVVSIVQEIERQPWSDIVQWGQGSSNDANGWHVDYNWYRPKGDEREFLFRLRDERAAAAAKGAR